MRTVTVYTRPGCHLCDEALATLQRIRGDAPFDLTEIDITRDDELHRRYLERIPVITLDGEELFDFEVDEAALRDRLAATAPARHGARAARRRGRARD